MKPLGDALRPGKLHNMDSIRARCMLCISEVLADLNRLDTNLRRAEQAASLVAVERLVHFRNGSELCCLTDFE